jgi:hypothetical protein
MTARELAADVADRFDDHMAANLSRADYDWLKAEIEAAITKYANHLLDTLMTLK